MFTSHSIRISAILILSLALAACTGGLDTSNRTQVPELSDRDSVGNDPEGTIVNVEARDFEFLMDATTVYAGVITFEVTNHGTMQHDFAIQVGGEQVKTPLLNPGQSDSFTVELEQGTYDYLCTVPGHDILGMRGSLTVQ